jgi:hypothetical protein
MQVRLEAFAADPANGEVDDRPALEETATLCHRGEITARIKYLEILCQTSRPSECPAHESRTHRRTTGAARCGAAFLAEQSGAVAGSPTVPASSPLIPLPIHNPQLSMAVTTPRLGEISAVPDFAAADVALVLADALDGMGVFVVLTSSGGIHRISPRTVEALADDLITASAADAIGAAKAMMNLAIEYAKVRMQSGRPIGSFQPVQYLCFVYETVELDRGGVIPVLWAVDAAATAQRHLATSQNLCNRNVTER